MNKKVLHTLEFDKILDRLSELASSPKAKERVHSLMPMTDIEETPGSKKVISVSLSTPP